MTQYRFDLDPYSVRVLDVIKGKFGLKNKNEALRKMMEVHGEQYAEMQVEEKILRDLDQTFKEHQKKTRRSMTDKELDTLLGL